MLKAKVFPLVLSGLFEEQVIQSGYGSKKNEYLPLFAKRKNELGPLVLILAVFVITNDYGVSEGDLSLPFVSLHVSSNA